jgi:hypothetical protein
VDEALVGYVGSGPAQVGGELAGAQNLAGPGLPHDVRGRLRLQSRPQLEMQGGPLLLGESSGSGVLRDGDTRGVRAEVMILFRRQHHGVLERRHRKHLVLVGEVDQLGAGGGRQTERPDDGLDAVAHAAERQT